MTKIKCPTCSNVIEIKGRPLEIDPESETRDPQETLLVQRRRNDSFRRAHDIRYKDPKTLKPYQLALFYELKIREEIEALEKEI